MQRRGDLLRLQGRLHHLVHSHKWRPSWVRKITLAFFFLLGTICGLILSSFRSCQFCDEVGPCTSSNVDVKFPSVDSPSRVLPNDLLQQNRSSVHSPTFAFLFATGRSGTQHLSLTLQSHNVSNPLRETRTTGENINVYVTHEEEDDLLRTRDVVCKFYRHLVRGRPSQSRRRNEAIYYEKMKAYVTKVKLPFYERLMRSHGNASHLIYTGHVPAAFGVLPALLDVLPTASVRVLRLRRDRLATALSLMALGPASEDPWDSVTKEDNSKYLRSGNMCHLRWFPLPWDGHIRLDSGQWEHMNRFQRWLWYVDDIECRWMALKHSRGFRFSYMEESLENLHILDGGAAWNRVANFLGASIRLDDAMQRHNSIQSKARFKLNVSEATLRTWDADYRNLVGPCKIDENVYIRWPSSISKKY